MQGREILQFLFFSYKFSFDLMKEYLLWKYLQREDNDNGICEGRSVKKVMIVGDDLVEPEGEVKCVISLESLGAQKTSKSSTPWISGEIGLSSRGKEDQNF